MKEKVGDQVDITYTAAVMIAVKSEATHQSKRKE